MIFPIPMGLSELIHKLFGPKPKFKKGDSVRLVSGNEKDLMVVQWGKMLKKSMLYSCKWYDSQTKSTRTNIFREDQLRQFDWYHPE